MTSRRRTLIWSAASALRRSVAQWLEHRSPKPGVAGSSPATPANEIKGLSQLYQSSIFPKNRTGNAVGSLKKDGLASSGSAWAECDGEVERRPAANPPDARPPEE